MKAACVVCGKEFEKTGRQSRKKTCGKECHKENLRARQREASRRYFLSHREERREYARRYHQQNRDKISRNRRRGRQSSPLRKPCIICGNAFAPRGSQKTCSKECSLQNKYNTDRKWHAHNKAHLRDYAAQRRAKDPRRYYLQRRAYEETNRERRREMNIAWLAANAEHRREWYRRRKAFFAAATALGVPPLVFAAMKLRERFTQETANAERAQD